MGQSSSAQRRADANRRPLPRLFAIRNLGSRNTTQASGNSEEEGSQSLLGLRSSLRLRSTARSRDRLRLTAPATVFRRQVSARTSPAERQPASEERPTSTQDAVVYEQEERPLMSVEDIRIGDAPISNITASPMPRSPSVIARLGSRLSQRYSSVEVGSFENDEETGNWPRASLDAHQFDWQPDSSTLPQNRRSLVGSIGGNRVSRPAGTRRRLASISRPLSMGDSTQYESLNAIQTPLSPAADSTQNDPFMPSESRLSRVRRSISGPLENLLGRVGGTRPQDSPSYPQSESVRPRSAEAGTADDAQYLLPPISIADAIDLEDSPAQAFDISRRNDPQPPESSSRSSWAERLSSRAPTIRRESRRVPNLLRGRSSRLIRRDDEMPLSRILQLAAAAIAAQLSGNSDALANLESVGDDQFDGGLNTFVDDLNTAAGSAAQSNQEGSSSEAGISPPPPLNFWRAFRFMGSGMSPRTVSTPGEEGEPRTVTLVVVGVRSVPSSSISREAHGANEPNLDTLLNEAPSLVGSNRTRRPRSFFRNANGRSPFGLRSRRSSISGPEPFLSQHDTQRQIQPSLRVRSETGGSGAAAISDTGHNLFTGSRPPPTSPAELSYLPPTHSTSSPISRRTSEISGLNTPLGMDMSEREAGSATNLASDRLRQINQEPQSPSSDPASPVEQPVSLDQEADAPQVRRRRRSDSELARFENLASHRNGTIDPDGGPLMGRSWLIYVVGTNLPADHPIFQVPSLLSDNPSYEDMLTLSNLLGPVRPPVATHNDVERAGGLYRLVPDTEISQDTRTSPPLRAVPLDGSINAPFTLTATDNCLVCLGGYSAAEELRELSKCQHRFHRACIDEWLTTGRNSCPLCRAAGVPREELVPSQPTESSSVAAPAS